MGAELNTFATSSDVGLSAPGAPLAIVGNHGAAAPHAALHRRHDFEPAASDSAGSRIKAVLFDVEDVLYDASAWNRWLAQIFGRLASKPIEEEFSRLWREQFLPQVHCGDQDFHAALAACLEVVGLAAAHVEEIVAASRAQRRRQENALRTFPGVRSTLGRLQGAGIGRAILTNADRTAAALRAELGPIGLEGSFDVVLTSLDLHASLPDEACYRQAVAAMNVSPYETLFVSHDPRDLHGAQAAGLVTVAFNARQITASCAQIDRFEELLELVVAASGTRSMSQTVV
jgi:HAD superfamily hydrolase (TIGR01509 family)